MSQAPPPPPPSGGAPGPSGSSPGFAVGDAVSYGWNAYWKNVGPMILITIVIIAVQIAVNLVGQFVGNVFISVIFSIVGWVVSMILSMGLIRASLAVVRGETPEVSLLFETEGLGNYIVAAIIFGICFGIGLILCIVPGIIIGIIWMFYGFVIVENPTTGAMDALKKSQEMTRGKLGELFVFGLALFGINLVGAILCGVGLLFTYGISAIAVAYAYRMLRGEPVAPIA